MEMLAVIDILRRVDDTIQSISRVLQGVEMLTPVTEKVALDLLKGEVPLIWSQIWEGPSNPNLWLRIVCKKALSLRGWLQRVQ
jgi:Dynein heavy chain C-terminal domain